MFRTTLKNLAAHKLRLLTTSLAVLLGVAFMAGTLVLTDTIGKTFDDLFADANEGTDAFVRGEVGLRATRCSATSGPGSTPRSSTPSPASTASPPPRATSRPTPSSSTRTASPSATPTWARPPRRRTGSTDADLNPFELAEGRAPAGRPTRSSSTRRSADDGGFAVGDTATVLTQAGPLQADGRRHRHASASRTAPAAPRYVAVHPDAAQAYLTEPGTVDAIKVVAEDGRRARASSSSASRRSSPTGPRCSPAPRSPPRTSRRHQGGHGASSTPSCWCSPLIALFVGSFIIYNSFSILVAQRAQGDGADAGHRRQPAPGARLGARSRPWPSGWSPRSSAWSPASAWPSGLKALLDAHGHRHPGRRRRRSRPAPSSSRWSPASASASPRPCSRLAGRRRCRRSPPCATSPSTTRPAAARGSSSASASPASVRPAMAAGLFGRRRRPRWSGSAPLLVFVGIAVLGPVIARPMSRLLGCAAAPAPGHGRARWPGRTPCGTRSAPRPRPRR